MTATATSASEKLASGSSTWRRKANARRVSKLERKPHQTNGNNIFRWYRAGWGRYSSADPLHSSAVSPYAYVDDNPMNWIDAWGLYKHKPGGPSHPSIPTRCGPEDSCSTLYQKYAEIEKTIEAHKQWIKEHPEDTVHLGEMDDWYNARNRCASWIRKNCSTRRDCKVCKKVAVPSALAIGGYIVYKVLEACFAPELLPVTP